MSTIYDLDDLDTAFPRHGSERGIVMFEKGHSLAFTTNATKDDFRKQFEGAMVRQTYYGKDMGAGVVKVIKILFYKRS